jgi:6-phosphogluconolactonase/glucosamine-6-phosphate isomerase/deaminase
MYEHFYGPAGIPAERIHVFNGLADPAAECGAMNDWLAARGPLGLTLLGVGMNGHIGFNEPNVPEQDGAIIVPLDEITKAVSVKYFGKERPVTTGLTLGLSALLKAQKILVMAVGAKKAPVIKNAFYGDKSPSNPASMLQGHPGLVLLLDAAANGGAA